MALPWHLESLNGIWLGVVFTDCAFSHFGVLLGFGVQRFDIRYCMFALSRFERKDLLLLVAASAKNLSGISFSRQYASQLQHGGVPM